GGCWPRRSACRRPSWAYRSPEPEVAMQRPEYAPLAEFAVGAASPSHQGFTLMGQGLDHAEYQLDLRFEMPLDQRTRTVLGGLLSHSDLTISRRTPGGLAAALRQRRPPNRASQR